MAVNRWAVLEAELWADLGEVQLTPEVRPEPGVRGGVVLWVGCCVLVE